MTAKRIVSALNEVSKSILDVYVYYDTIFKLTEKYQPQRLDKVISRQTNHNISVDEIKDQYEKQSKHLISQLEEAIAERVKLTL